MQRHLLKGISVPVVWELRNGLNTIGRNPTNDHTIRDVSVSSFHCEITLEGQSVLVRDLQSTNGTFINDQPITEAVLVDGEILQLGTVPFRLIIESFEVRIPQVPKSEPVVASPVLPDGATACQKNSAVAATHRCEKCEGKFNFASLRGVRLSQGKSYLLFCPNCDGKCTPIEGIQSQRNKESLLGRLTKTISLGFGRKSR